MAQEQSYDYHDYYLATSWISRYLSALWYCQVEYTVCSCSLWVLLCEWGVGTVSSCHNSTVLLYDTRITLIRFLFVLYSFIGYHSCINRVQNVKCCCRIIEIISTENNCFIFVIFRVCLISKKRKIYKNFTWTFFFTDLSFTELKQLMSSITKHFLYVFTQICYNRWNPSLFWIFL